LKRVIISGEQLIQGESPSVFQPRLDFLNYLLLEIRAGSYPPCLAILSGEEHALTLKYLVSNMIAGEESVLCFDVPASKGNPWDKQLPTVAGLELPAHCQVFIIFGFAEMDDDDFDDFHQRCIENGTVLVLMDQDIHALEVADFTLPEKAPILFFNEDQELVHANTMEPPSSQAEFYKKDPSFASLFRLYAKEVFYYFVSIFLILTLFNLLFFNTIGFSGMLLVLLAVHIVFIMRHFSTRSGEKNVNKN